MTTIRKSIQPVLDRYNKNYHNPAYMSVSNAVAAHTIDGMEHNQIMNLIIDAAIEICGWSPYDGSRDLVLECARAIGGLALRAEVANYLLRFEDEEELPF